MTVGREIRSTQDHGDRTGAGRERRELLTKRRRVRFGALQTRNGRLRQETTRLPVDHHAVVDLASLDHVAHDLHAIQEGEAGVADVEVHARIGQLQVSVNQTRSRRLDVVVTYGSVDHDAEAAAVEFRVFERGFRQVLEQVRRQAETLHRLAQLELDLGRRHDLRRVDVANAQNREVLEIHHRLHGTGREKARIRPAIASRVLAISGPVI